MGPSVIASCLAVLLVGAASGHVWDRSRDGSSSSTTTASDLSVADHLNSLDQEDRRVFIKVHLAQGLNLRASEIPYADNDTIFKLPGDLHLSRAKYEEIQEMEVPGDFSENLLDYTRQEFALDYDDVHALVLQSSVCFPNGVCTDVDDIGSVCCPF